MKRISVKSISKNHTFKVYETSVKLFAYFHSRHGAGNSSSLLTFTHMAQSRAVAVKGSMKRFLWATLCQAVNNTCSSHH